MAIPIPLKIRQKIIELRKQSIPYAQIAEQLSVSESAAKKLWRRYRQEGESGLLTRYENCGRKPTYGAEMRAVILSHQESEQGGPYVRSILQEQYPDVQIPHERTMQRWWRANGGGKRIRQSARPKPAPWAKEAHAVWQIDGKEQIQLGNEEVVSWVNIVDEASRSPLRTEAFPLRDDESISPEAVPPDLQQGLRPVGDASDDQD